MIGCSIHGWQLLLAQVEARGGYFTWISCKHVQRLISRNNTEICDWWLFQFAAANIIYILTCGESIMLGHSELATLTVGSMEWWMVHSKKQW